LLLLERLRLLAHVLEEAPACIWGLSTSRAPLNAYDPLCVGSAGGRRLIHEVRFVQDSPLEEDGFEPSVPLWCDLDARARCL